MAIFPNDDLVSVQTPTGVVMLPRSVAGSLSLSTQAPPPMDMPITNPTGSNNPSGPPPPPPPPAKVSKGGKKPADEAPGARSDVPPGALAGGAAPPASQASPTQGAPGTSLPPSYVLDLPATPVGAAIAARTGQSTPLQHEDEASVDTSRPPPERVPPPSFEGANANLEEGASKQIEAARQKADLEANQQKQVAAAYAEQAAAHDKAFADEAARMQDLNNRIAQKNAWVDSTVQKLANTKIDHSADHPVLAGIGLVLSAFGSAWQKQGTNPAMDAFYQAIDRKVAAQVQDFERTGKIIGMTRDQIGALQNEVKSSRDMYDFLMAGALEKASLQIKAVAANTQSQAAKSNALAAEGDIQAKKGELQAGIANNLVAHEDRQAQVRQEDINNQRSTSAANYATSVNRQNTVDTLKQQYKIHQENNEVELAKDIAQYSQQKGKDAAAAVMKGKEETEKRGIQNPVTKMPLMTAAGNQKMREAEALEIQAKETEDAGAGGNPAAAFARAQRAQMLREQATNLRTEAQTVDSWKVGSPEERQKLAEKYSAAQGLFQVGKQINDLYDKYGADAWTKQGEGQAALSAAYSQYMMSLKQAWGLGVLSKQDINLVSKAMGGADPSQPWDEDLSQKILYEISGKFGKDPASFKGALKTLSGNAADTVYNDFSTRPGFSAKRADMFAEIPDDDKKSKSGEALSAATKDLTQGEYEAANAGSTGKSIGKTVLGAGISPFTGPAVAYKLLKNGGTPEASSDYGAAPHEGQGEVVGGGLTKNAVVAVKNLASLAVAGESAQAEINAAKRAAKELPNETELKRAVEQGQQAQTYLLDLAKSERKEIASGVASVLSSNYDWRSLYAKTPQGRAETAGSEPSEDSYFEQDPIDNERARLGGAAPRAPYVPGNPVQRAPLRK